MLNKRQNPTHYDSYGRRQLTRSSVINETLDADLSGNPTLSSLKNSGSSGVASNANYTMNNYPVRVNPSGTDCCNPDTNNYYDDDFGHSLYLKYHNLRIKFVGFIYNNVNYIVDLDNRNVSYKPVKESCWRHYNTKLSVSSNALLKSYQLSFKLIGNNEMVTCEVYPNDISCCKVEVTNIVSHERQILSNDYINYEFYSKKNMLDSDGNIITYLNYANVFRLTVEEIMMLFTHQECATLIYDMLNLLNESKDSNIVTNELLIQIRNQMSNVDYNNGYDDIINNGNNNSNNNCSHGCCCDNVKYNLNGSNSNNGNNNNNTSNNGTNNSGNNNCSCDSNYPFTPIKENILYEVEREDIAGLYRSEMNDTIDINIDSSVIMERFKEENLIWEPYYIVGDSGRPIALIIRIKHEDGITYNDFAFNPITKELKELNKRMNKYSRVKSGKVNFNLNAVFVFTREDGCETEKTLKLFRNGLLLGNNTNIGSFDAVYDVLLSDDMEKAEVYFVGDMRDTFFGSLELSFESNNGYTFKYRVSDEKAINAKHFTISKDQIKKGALDTAYINIVYNDSLEDVRKEIMVRFKESGSSSGCGCGCPGTGSGSNNPDDIILTKIIPPGGKEGQFLTKASDKSYDLKWESIDIDYMDNSEIEGIFDKE